MRRQGGFYAMGAIAMVAGVSPVMAQAQRFENLDRLDSLVAMTVGAAIGEPGGASAPVDRRLKLTACPQLPEVNGPVFGAAMVECKTLGWRIRVPLRAGGAAGASAVPASAQRSGGFVRPAAAEVKTAVVRKGDPVQLVAGGGSFTVSRLMVADEDGGPGDMIRVREDRKSAPILAQVVEIGVVRVPGI
ncbi:MAG: flagellar protein [Sphingobium sp.]|nr:flagellar protein [Sphingobium sp.]